MLVVVLLLLAATAAHGQRDSPLIKIGSTYYMPLYKINDLETAATISGARQLLQGGYSSPSVSGGYDSPAPTRPTPQTRKYPAVPPSAFTKPTQGGYGYKPASTRPPPLAEQNPTSADDAELKAKAPSAVSPEREAVLPTTQAPIGLEFEQEIESTAVEAKPPRPVTDTPDFEINDDGDYGVKIPGVPGRDYPIYAAVPTTSFRCSGYTYSGYFGDIEARCQSFHVCLRRTERSSPQKWSFLCPNGTIFNQRSYACSWWHESTPCNDAPKLYSLNADVNWEEVTERSMKRIIQSQTGVFGDVASKLLQVERSRSSTSSKSKSLTTGQIQKSESIAFEDKSIGASGFIFNRRPSQLDSGKTPSRPSSSAKTPAGVRNPNGQTVPNTPQQSVYGPPNHVAPEPTYLPPRTTPAPQPTYLPPRTTPTPGIEVDQDALDPQETGPFVPPSKPKVGFETSTVVPITKLKPKLTYLPPRPYLPPSSSPAVTYRSKDSDTINKILATSNIVDKLSDNDAFQGFSNVGLGTKSQIFNSNIRELLRGNQVQEINPGFLDLENSPNSAEGVEPLKAFLSSQGELNDQQRLEIHQFDQMALFVPQENQETSKSRNFPYVQPQSFPLIPRQTQPVVLQAAAKSLLQGAPVHHPGLPQFVSQAQATYAAPPAPAPLRSAPLQPVQLPRQPLLIPQQPIQPVARVQQFLLTPNPTVQQPAQAFRQVYNNRPQQQQVLYAAPQQQPRQSYEGQLYRAQSYALPLQEHTPIYTPQPTRDQSGQPSVGRPLIGPTDQPEIIPSITIHSSTIVSRGRNSDGLQGGYSGQQASGSTNSVSLLRPATHFSKSNFFSKLTPKYQNSGYNANRPLPKYVPTSALKQKGITFDRFRLVPQPPTQKSHYGSRTVVSSTPKAEWTDYHPSPTAQSVTATRGQARRPIHNSSTRVAQGSSSALGFRQYPNKM